MPRVLLDQMHQHLPDSNPLILQVVEADAQDGLQLGVVRRGRSRARVVW